MIRKFAAFSCCLAMTLIMTGCGQTETNKKARGNPPTTARSEEETRKIVEQAAKEHKEKAMIVKQSMSDPAAAKEAAKKWGSGSGKISKEKLAPN